MFTLYILDLGLDIHDLDVKDQDLGLGLDIVSLTPLILVHRADV